MTTAKPDTWCLLCLDRLAGARLPRTGFTLRAGAETAPSGVLRCAVGGIAPSPRWVEVDTGVNLPHPVEEIQEHAMSTSDTLLLCVCLLS